MTNQQVKAHCEDVIANPQDHLDWVVDMAKALLPCLEAVPVKTKLKYSSALPKFIGDTNEVESVHCWVHGNTPEFATNEEAYAEAQKMTGDLYTAPPVPELKPIELPPKAPDDLHRVLDGYEKWLIATTFRDTWNACRDEVLRLNGVKS